MGFCGEADGDCLASWHFVSRSLRFRGVVNQANTSRPARLYDLARRTRRRAFIVGIHL